MQKNQPQMLHAWCMYDWANSTYSLTITSAIFPIYFLAIAVSGNNQPVIDFLFWKDVPNAVVYAYAYSFSSLLIAVLNPLVSSVADATGKQGLFMRFFCYVGVACCFLLFFSTKQHIEFTVFIFIISSVAYSCSIVFCNSFLPIIATPDRYESVSAKGYALGYVGGVLMLAFNLLMILQPTLFGFTAEMIAADLPTRISFVLVGVWWWVFAEYAFYYLPKGSKKVGKEQESSSLLRLMTQGYVELGKVGKALKDMVRLRTFLISFFFYNMGLQTVMGLATLFGKGELNLPQTALITTILILQLVGAIGALFFSQVSKRIGNIETLMICVGLWIGICVYAYTVRTANEFYILAMAVGWVMGGIQALSRATYAMSLPADTQDTASFFGFYDATDKIGTVFGTFLYGFIHYYTGNMRYSLLALSIFFIIGLAGLQMVRKQHKDNLAY